MIRLVAVLLICGTSVCAEEPTESASADAGYSSKAIAAQAADTSSDTSRSGSVSKQVDQLFAPLSPELVFGDIGCDSFSCVGSTCVGSSCDDSPLARGGLRRRGMCGPRNKGGCKRCEAARAACFRSLCDPPCCQRNWLDVDFMLFFSGGYNVPALVAGSVPGTPRPQVGILGDPATSILLGNEDVGDDGLFGARIEFGRWLDNAGNTALVGSLFGFGNETLSTFPADPNDIVSRPFFNVDPNVNALDAELVNYPGIVSGSIDVLSDTNLVSGAVGLQRRLFCCTNPADRCSGRRFDGFLGFRSFSFDENLVITERLFAAGGLIPAGTTFDVVDRFETENQFIGVEVGLSSIWQRQRWTFELGGRLALGNLDQDFIIDGATTVTVPNQPAVLQPYGILAGTSNIGTYERDQLGVLSQLNAEVGYQLSYRWRVTAGYSFIMLNDVVRPGDAIDLNVNGTHIDPNIPDSGPNLPAFSWVSETLSLHGFRAGFEFVF